MTTWDVSFTVSVGTPEIAPVDALNDIPFGNAGEIAKDFVPSPPFEVGV